MNMSLLIIKKNNRFKRIRNTFVHKNGSSMMNYKANNST